MDDQTTTTDLQPFTFEGNPLRIAMVDGEPWFVAQDVCAVLGNADPSMVLTRLDADEKGTHSVGTTYGTREMLTVNESGLYGLAFTSRKAAAKRFRKWVTGTVLPSIRKHGAYIAGQEHLNADEIRAKAEAATASIIAERERALEQARETIAILKPLANAYDHLSNTKGLRTLQEAAKEIGIPLKALTKHLAKRKIITKARGKWKPYAGKAKWAVVKTVPDRHGRADHTWSETFLTARTIADVARRAIEAGLIKAPINLAEF